MDLSEFEQRIGYTFQRRDLLTRAITHKSYAHEARLENVRHNETFEFLGDSVLGFVIGDMLFRNFPDLDEGALSKMKAYLVSATSLAEKARAFGMGDGILLGVGEEKISRRGHRGGKTTDRTDFPLTMSAYNSPSCIRKPGSRARRSIFWPCAFRRMMLMCLSDSSNRARDMRLRRALR